MYKMPPRVIYRTLFIVIGLLAVLLGASYIINVGV